MATESKVASFFAVRAAKPKKVAANKTKVTSDIMGGFARAPAAPQPQTTRKRRADQELVSTRSTTPARSSASAQDPAPASVTITPPAVPPAAPPAAPLAPRPRTGNLRLWTLRPTELRTFGDDGEKLFQWLRIRLCTKHSPGGMHGALLVGKAGTGKTRLLDMCCERLGAEKMVVHPWSAASADMVERTAVQGSVQLRKPTVVVVESAELWALRRQARTDESTGRASACATFSFESWSGGMPIVLLCCDMSLAIFRELDKSGKWKVFKTTPYNVKASMLSNMVAAVVQGGSATTNARRLMGSFDGDVRNLLVRSRFSSATSGSSSSSSGVTADYTVFEATKAILGNQTSLTKADAMASADSRLAQYLWWNAPKVAAASRMSLEDLAAERELWSKMDATYAIDVRRFAARWARIAPQQDLTTSRLIDIPQEAHWRRRDVAKRSTLDDLSVERFRCAK